MSNISNIIEVLESLLQEGRESEVVEFKEAKNDYDFRKLGRYFSALSNEANLQGVERAWLVFGIKDTPLTVIGSQYRPDQAHLMSLKEEVAKQTTGNLTFSQIHITEKDGKRVVLFDIPPAPQGIPIAWQGHYYARDNEALTALNINEQERIRRQSGATDWSANVCPNASIEDLSSEALALAKEKYAEKNPHLKQQIEAWDDVTFLNKSKLTIDGNITNTALLLLGKPESSHHLSPAVSRITWILKDRDGIEKDYAHFYSPLLLAVDSVYHKIRKITYRYMVSNNLFPDEVEQYEPYLIREALNNALAHQDYEKGGHVVVVENESDSLVFANEGEFLPGSVEQVIRADAPSTHYRNKLLVEAMVNLKLIDTIGSGIKKMFSLQKNKFFPLPEYDLSSNRITVAIYGKVLDLNYALKLAQMPNLTLEQIILLDKVQKKKDLTSEEAKEMKKHKLIEGRKPNYHISENVAAQTEQAVDYMKQLGADTEYCRNTILTSLKKFNSMSRREFEDILLPKISEQLSETQKKDRVKNILQALRGEGKIEFLNGKKWTLVSDSSSKTD